MERLKLEHWFIRIKLSKVAKEKETFEKKKEEKGDRGWRSKIWNWWTKRKKKMEKNKKSFIIKESKIRIRNAIWNA